VDHDLASWHSADQRSAAEWIGDHPESVVAVHAVVSGQGRAWRRGPAGRPDALIIEPAILPGEAIAYGQAVAVADLLVEVAGITCVEATPGLIDQLEPALSLQWRPLRRVSDVVHVLPGPPSAEVAAPLDEVRPLDPEEILRASRAHSEMWPPAIDVVVEAASLGRVFGSSLTGSSSPRQARTPRALATQTSASTLRRPTVDRASGRSWPGTRVAPCTVPASCRCGALASTTQPHFESRADSASWRPHA
jgi:hypothetical protein